MMHAKLHWTLGKLNTSEGMGMGVWVWGRGMWVWVCGYGYVKSTQIEMYVMSVPRRWPVKR